MKDPNDDFNQKGIYQIPKITQNNISQFVLDRFEEIKQNSSMDDMVKFHSNNKYLLMAHSQEKLKTLGNIVANHQKKSICELLLDYENHLNSTLDKTPTVKTHINVLMHIFGFFGKHLNQNQKKAYLDLIKEYRGNKISLGKILCLIEPITYQINATYLISQTYFLIYTESVKTSFDEMPTQIFTTKKD